VNFEKSGLLLSMHTMPVGTQVPQQERRQKNQQKQKPMHVDYFIRNGSPEDVQFLINTSQIVQAHLSASGSLQQIGPFDQEYLSSQIASKQVFIISRSEEDGSLRDMGSVIIEDLGNGNVTGKTKVPELLLAREDSTYSPPYFHLHSLMLLPEFQKQKIGCSFLSKLKERIAKDGGGSLFLDCWNGNNKLREFYERNGFNHLGDLDEKDYQVSLYCTRLEPL
jgi:ribosomal protein S18 acetylase RimI-like enzyme